MSESAIKSLLSLPKLNQQQPNTTWLSFYDSKSNSHISLLTESVLSPLLLFISLSFASHSLPLCPALYMFLLKKSFCTSLRVLFYGRGNMLWSAIT